MKSIPELLVGMAIISGAIYLFYQKTSGLIKIVSVAALAFCLLSSIAVFIIGQRYKTKS